RLEQIVSSLQAIRVRIVPPEVGLHVGRNSSANQRVRIVICLLLGHAGQAQVGFGGLDQILYLAVVSGGAGADAQGEFDIIQQGHRPSPQRKRAPGADWYPAPRPYSSPFPLGSAFFLMRTTPFGSASLPSAIIVALLTHSSLSSSK